MGDPGTMVAARRGRQRGFLLLEVLIALLIVTLALSALIRLQIEIRQTGNAAGEHALALGLAVDRLEDLTSMVRSSTTPGPLSGLEVLSTGPDGEPLPAAVIYHREWVMSPGDGVMQIDVTVDWPGRDGRQQRIMLSTRAQPAAAHGSALLAPAPMDPIRLP